MFDPRVTQSAGLQHIGRQLTPRVIAMASHGNQQGEMPLLWSLCSTLVELGYSVAVLDAHTSESADNLGLAQLLEGAPWPNDGLSEADSWSVIPAAHGLRHLAARWSETDRPLAPLGGVLENYGVIVIYARADTLIHLLPGTGIEPLLTVSPLKMSSVTAYQSLKQMLLNAGLRPTVAHIALKPSAGPETATQSAAQKLQECALAFLGYRVDALTIRAGDAEEKITDDVHQLTLRLLENAMPLHRYQLGGSL